MRNEAGFVLFIAILFGCDRSSSSGHGGGSSRDASEERSAERGDRSLENSGCAWSFSYGHPYFPEGDGFVGLPVARDGDPGKPAFEFDRSGEPPFGVLVDSVGKVFRYVRPDAGIRDYTLTGRIEHGTLARMLALRQASATAPSQTFTTRCADSNGGGNTLNVYGLDPPLKSPFVLATGGGMTAKRHVSAEADTLIRWMLAVSNQAELVPPMRTLPPKSGSDGKLDASAVPKLTRSADEEHARSGRSNSARSVQSLRNSNLPGRAHGMGKHIDSVIRLSWFPQEHFVSSGGAKPQVIGPYVTSRHSSPAPHLVFAVHLTR